MTKSFLIDARKVHVDDDRDTLFYNGKLRITDEDGEVTTYSVSGSEDRTHFVNVKSKDIFINEYRLFAHHLGFPLDFNEEVDTEFMEQASEVWYAVTDAMYPIRVSYDYLASKLLDEGLELPTAEELARLGFELCRALDAARTQSKKKALMKDFKRKLEEFGIDDYFR